jgi:threonine synthase
MQLHFYSLDDGASYQQVLREVVLERFPMDGRDGVSPADIRVAVSRAYTSFDDPTNVVPVVPLSVSSDDDDDDDDDDDKKNNNGGGGDVFIVEQWHGPTRSFKDLSLQLLPVSVH